jgi:hypothetical protein
MAIHKWDKAESLKVEVMVQLMLEYWRQRREDFVN